MGGPSPPIGAAGCIVTLSAIHPARDRAPWAAEQTCWRGRQRIERPSGCWFRDYDAASAEQHQQRSDATCRLPHPAGGGGGGGTPAPPNQAHGGGPVQQSRWEWPVYHASSLLRHVACEGMTHFNCPTCRRGRHERSRAARAAAGRRCAGGWSSSGPAAGLRHRAGIQEGAGRQMGCVQPLFVLKAAMPARLPSAAHAQRVRVRSDPPSTHACEQCRTAVAPSDPTTRPKRTSFKMRHLLQDLTNKRRQTIPEDAYSEGPEGLK